MVLEELDGRNDNGESLESEEKDSMHVYNLIHDGAPSIGGLDVLAMVTLIPSNATSTPNIF